MFIATSKRPTDASTAIEMLREHSLATLAQQELERRIVSGEIAAGTKLNEVEVASALGVSRGPVREAFSALSQAGLVRVEKNRGVFVRQVSLEEANEFYEVRAALEGLIGKLAARRIAIDEIEQLRAVVRRMHQIQKSRRADDYFALNVEFHDVLARAAAQQRAAGPLPRRGQPTRPVPSRHDHPGCREHPAVDQRGAEAIVEAVAATATSGAPRPCSPNMYSSAARGCMPRWAPQAPRLEAQRVHPFTPVSAGPLMNNAKASVNVNGTSYRWPCGLSSSCASTGRSRATSSRACATAASRTSRGFVTQGFSAVANGDVPSFTCPNNMSITTGSPPAVHGISGNFYLDPATGEPVVMTGPELLRSRTIMAEFSRHGARVVSITAKDKLRRQLGKEMSLAGGSVNFSAEFADQCTMEETGVAELLLELGTGMPSDMYSPELSLFVLEAGIKLLRERRPDILYLSLTDYVQHKYAPGEPGADRYYKNMDDKFGAPRGAGAVVALTADHGMNDKSNPDGVAQGASGSRICSTRASAGARARSICPITDRFVAHHGALGGFVRVCARAVTARQIIDAIGGAAAWSWRWTVTPPAACSSCRWTARATWWSSATPARASAPPRTTTSPASRAIASAPTAAPPRAGCRSS